MPTRLIREGILTSEKKPARWIPTAIRRRLRAMPCAICGINFDIHCDHIHPISKGGESTEENLQPLCRDCNYAKKHLRSNDETRLVIQGRGLGHFVEAAYRYGTRNHNPYDRPSLEAWTASNPESLRIAKSLFLAFSKSQES